MIAPQQLERQSLPFDVRANLAVVRLVVLDAEARHDSRR